MICDGAPPRGFHGEDAIVAIVRLLPGVCRPCEGQRIARRVLLETVQEHSMPQVAGHPQVEDTDVLARL